MWVMDMGHPSHPTLAGLTLPGRLMYQLRVSAGQTIVHRYSDVIT